MNSHPEHDSPRLFVGTPSSGGGPVVIGVLLTAALLLGCRSYRAEPLTRESLDDALTVPELRQLSEEWNAHPRAALPAIQLDAADGLDPTEAACLAVMLNPALRAERARRGITAAEAVQAGLLPNPQLSLAYDVPVGSNAPGTVDAFGLGLGWDLAALIEHDARVDEAEAADRAAALDLLWQEWRVACTARLAATRALWEGRSCETLREAVADAEAARDELRAALDDGLTTRLVVEAADTALAAYTSQLLSAERAREQSELEVARTIGFTPSAGYRFVDGDRAWLDPSSDLDSTFTLARERRVDLAALRAGYDAQEARLRAAVLAQFPRLSLGLNAARDTGDVSTIGLGATVDLPIFDRSQGRIAVEEATRATLRAEYSAREFELRAELAAVLAELGRLDREIAAQGEFARRITELLAGLEDQEARQMVDSISVEQLRATSITARLDLLRLQQRRAELRVALETLTGCLHEGERE